MSAAAAAPTSSSSLPTFGIDAVTLSHLIPLISLSLSEDVGSGDVTTLSTIPESSRSRAHFLAKETGVLSGLAIASYVFATIDHTIRVEWSRKDGDKVEKGTYFGEAYGR